MAKSVQMETPPEPYFEVYKDLGPEAMTPPINPDRRSLTNFLKFVVSLCFLIISICSLIGFISTKLDIISLFD